MSERTLSLPRHEVTMWTETKQWLQSWFTRETLIAWVFLFPSLVGFTLFYAVPAARGLLISFTDWNLLTPANNIGVENYRRLMQDEQFWHALKVTAYYVLLNIPLQTALAMVIAVLMDRFAKGILVRSALILPWLMPNVVVALLWLWLLDPSLGIVNQFLEVVGIGRQPFLSSVGQAMPAIAGINIWRHVGYTALLLFAGLQTIPKSVYEAARIDGASEPRIFWSITIPLLRPVLVFVLVTTVVGSFQIFDTVAITTQGGPVNATKVIYWYIFEHAFERFNMGYATAISVVVFLILVTVSLIQMRVLRAGESDL